MEVLMKSDTKSKPVKFENFEDFLAWEKTSQSTVDFKTAYADLAGDIHAGLLLSQVIYWYLPSKKGASKLRVWKNGYNWIAKARYDWWDEVRLTPRQVDRAKKVLQDKGFIIVKQHLFNGMRTDHYRLVPEVLLPALEEIINNPPVNPHRPRRRTGEQGFSEMRTPESPIQQDRNSEIDNTQVTKSNTPLTETISETTTEKTSENLERGTASAKKPQLSYATFLPTQEMKKKEIEETRESRITKQSHKEIPTEDDIPEEYRAPAPWMYSFASAIESNIYLDRPIQVWMAKPLFERLDKACRACLKYVDLIAEHYLELREETEMIPTGHLLSEIASIPLDQLEPIGPETRARAQAAKTKPAAKIGVGPTLAGAQEEAN
jgi:hypothetical protein